MLLGFQRGFAKAKTIGGQGKGEQEKGSKNQKPKTKNQKLKTKVHGLGATVYRERNIALAMHSLADFLPRADIVATLFTLSVLAKAAF